MLRKKCAVLALAGRGGDAGTLLPSFEAGSTEKCTPIQLRGRAELGMLPGHMSNKNDGSDEVARQPDPSQGESSSVQEKERRESEEPVAESAVTGAPPKREQDEESEQDEAAATARDTDAADSGDEEGSDEASRHVASERAARKRKAKRVGGRGDPKGKKSAPLTEEEIDSPSKQTLAMLGVVAGATLVMWGVGRAKCNYHEVGEGMKPREVTLEERTRTPQDVAFAFQHALSSYDFKVAEKLATGEAKRLVTDRKGQCKGSSCESKRESLKGKVNSMAELLKRTPTHALARVWSEGPQLSAQKHVAVLEREGRNWRVDTYSRDTGKEVELPGSAPAMGHDGAAQGRVHERLRGDGPPAAGSAAPSRVSETGASEARSRKAPPVPKVAAPKPAATPKPAAPKPAAPKPPAQPAPVAPSPPAAPAPATPGPTTGSP